MEMCYINIIGQTREKTMNNKIMLEKTIIDNDSILVCSEHTTYFNETFVTKLTLSDLLDTYKMLISKARKNNVKICAAKGMRKVTEPLISELYAEYQEKYAEYTVLYDELKKGVTEKVTNGIFSPTSDDLELAKLYEIRNKMMGYFYRSSIISKIHEFHSELENHIVSVETKNKDIISRKIYLSL